MSSETCVGGLPFSAVDRIVRALASRYRDYARSDGFDEMYQRGWEVAMGEVNSASWPTTTNREGRLRSRIKLRFIDMLRRRYMRDHDALPAGDVLPAPDRRPEAEAALRELQATLTKVETTTLLCLQAMRPTLKDTTKARRIAAETGLPCEQVTLAMESLQSKAFHYLEVGA